MPVMSLPSNTIAPLVEGRVPASTARNVDLPAPFGPMRPVICPRGTSSDTPSTACMPSKCRCTSRAVSMGVAAAAAMLGVLSYRGALEDPARLRPHPLRPEPEEADDEQADRNPLHGRDEVWRGHPAADGGRDQTGDLEKADRHQQRTEDRPDVVAAAADDHRGE